MRHQNVKKLFKLFKNINFIKIIVDKELYESCAIKKGKKVFYKFHIRLDRKECELIYNDICDFITPRDYNENKYFIIFLNN